MNHLLTGLGLKPRMPNRLGQNPAVCGGLKPFSVNELAENPQARALELAQQLSSYARCSFSTTKRSIELAEFPYQETVLQAELDAASYCFASQEAKEEFAAFRKRKQES